MSFLTCTDEELIRQAKEFYRPTVAGPLAARVWTKWIDGLTSPWPQLRARSARLIRETLTLVHLDPGLKPEEAIRRTIRGR